MSGKSRASVFIYLLTGCWFMINYGVVHKKHSPGTYIIYTLGVSLSTYNNDINDL